MQDNFFADWLENRYRFDARARNRSVEAACIDACTCRNIVDLGAGTGANWAYYHDRFGSDQHWTLIDVDAELLHLARQRILDTARSGSYEVEASAAYIRIGKEEVEIQIRFLHGSLFDLRSLMDLSTVDLITANAVFDLCSFDAFSSWLNQLSSYTGGLLFTINYTGMQWNDASKADALFIDLYDKHMKRPQAFGRAMGPDCGAGMRQAFHALGWKILEGDSPWHIGVDDVELQTDLLRFMASSIPELELTADQQSLFERWLVSKKEQVQQRRSSLVVNHLDFFASKSA